MLDKTHWRQQLLAERTRLAEPTRLAAEHSIIQRVLALPQWRKAEHIAGYSSVCGEVDTATLMQQAWLEDKQFYLPLITQTDRHLLFAAITKNSPLLPNRYHILEPSHEAADMTAAMLMDIMLIPMVGFSQRCERLGMGKAYYDKTLAPLLKLSKRPLFIGLAFECQKMASFPSSPWDVDMDMVVTEANIYLR